MEIWQLQEAKAKLSQFVQDAISLGPQQISVRGKVAGVFLSQKDYDKLVKYKKKNLVEIMQNSPLYGLDLDLKRDQTGLREIDL